MKVGFIGTGAMGLPMMQNVVKQDHAVMAYDLDPASLAAAVKSGATKGSSAAEVAKASEVVITMLPSSSNVEACLLGPQGVAAAAKRGTLCVDMSTIDPSTSRRMSAALQEKGLRFVDAPVSGGVGRASWRRSATI
jgi:3-hydroxyisobutyrate dehydrogenase-like beta-hydroxyacid dehydrogenase